MLFKTSDPYQQVHSGNNFSSLTDPLNQKVKSKLLSTNLQTILLMQKPNKKKEYLTH